MHQRLAQSLVGVLTGVRTNCLRTAQPALTCLSASENSGQFPLKHCLKLSKLVALETRGLRANLGTNH